MSSEIIESSDHVKTIVTMIIMPTRASSQHFTAQSIPTYIISLDLDHPGTRKGEDVQVSEGKRQVKAVSENPRRELVS